MGQRKVTYEDKQNNIAITNRKMQATAEDFNEIKQVINDNADDLENRITSDLSATEKIASIEAVAAMDNKINAAILEAGAIGIENTLGSTSTTNALAANQGRVLDKKIEDSSVFYPFANTSGINNNIVELFVGNGDPLAEYKILTLAYTHSLRKLNLIIMKNDVMIGRIENLILSDEIKYETIKAVKQIVTNEEIYILLKNLDSDFAYSNVIMYANKITDISYCNNILQGLISSNTEDINKILGIYEPVKFTNNNDFNDHLLELYLLNWDSNYKVTQINAKSDEIKLFMNDGTKIVTNGYNNIGVEEYGKVITLYDNNTDNGNVVGYVVFKYTGVDFALALTANTLEAASDVNNSPLIKKYIESEEQIVLIGDSLFGITNVDNVLKDFLINYTDKRVYNCGFGGCRMAYRTIDGSNDYDKFSFPAVADSIVSQNFTAMRAADLILNSFRIRISDLEDVDFTKPTTIICNYSNNDLTGPSAIGSLWEYDAPSFDKTTLLGAMNYGVKAITNAYKHIRFIFLTPAWRIIDGLPPYLYFNTNGDSAINFADKMQENAKRAGFPIINFTEFGNRNAYNVDYLTLDGTHFNFSGYIRFAKRLAKLDSSFYNE